jgi:hypothetical protein
MISGEVQLAAALAAAVSWGSSNYAMALEKLRHPFFCGSLAAQKKTIAGIDEAEWRDL